MVPGRINHDMFVTAIEQAGAKNRTARLHDIRVKTCLKAGAYRHSTSASSDGESEVLAHLHDDVQSSQRVEHGRQTPRDLPQRLPASCIPQASHLPRDNRSRPQTSGHKGLRISA